MTVFSNYANVNWNAGKNVDCNHTGISKVFDGVDIEQLLRKLKFSCVMYLYVSKSLELYFFFHCRDVKMDNAE